MARKSICLLLVMVITGNLYSQNLRKNQELFLEAEYFMMFGDYIDALPMYLQLKSEYPENYNLSHKIGLCYLNIDGQKDRAIEYLEEAADNSVAIYREGTLKQKTASYIAWYDLATAYRINYKFDKAKEAFKRYSVTLLPENTEDRLFIEHQIKVCENAKELISNPVEFTEENIGEQFNDSNSNFHPIVSGDGSSFVYMSGMKFYDAVFYAKKVKNKWAGPLNITPEIQSDGDLYVSCLSRDGNQLYITRVVEDKSDIYSSTYDGTKWSVARKLNENISSRYWDAHAYLFPDGKTLIFASDRPGGFGGLDLYISKMNEDGEWGTPTNLGPEINTAFNEDRPSICEDEKTLFFCSQGHYNMGGFDIFKAVLLENGHWKEPVNIGYPINTPDDDTFFMPVNNGRNGYISAYRQDKGFGKEDIYYITFK